MDHYRHTFLSFTSHVCLSVSLCNHLPFISTFYSHISPTFLFLPLVQGQADLLKHARSEVLENLKQIHYAALTCQLAKGGGIGGSGGGSFGGSESRGRRSLQAIPEKAQGEEDITDEDN